MKMAFFELEGWERPVIQARLEGHELLFFEEALGPRHHKDVADCGVISPFIYSAINEEFLALATDLKLVVTRSTGYDHIDVEACRKHGVAVANVPEYGAQTVAEHSFALILALSRKIVPAQRAMRSSDAGLDSARELRGFDLRGRTLGVVGAGNIGLHVIRMAKSFGMRVLVYDMMPRKTLGELLEFEYTDLDTLLQASDIVSLHCPANAATRHMIDRGTLARMRPGAILINTARGELVNTSALLEALQSGHLGGAGLDVFEGEALVREEAQILSRAYDREQLENAIHAHQLLKRDDVILTPHNGFNSREAVERILDTTLENIQKFLEGHRQNGL